ncbi:MAG: hypothetical protein R3C99_04035 [Pirellulaceae bacterium]
MPRTQRIAELDSILQEVPTHHARCVATLALQGVEPNSVHLILIATYWNLEYRDSEGQLGHIDSYEQFLDELDQVWQRCFDVLVPGGRLICVVGDVCLSRRRTTAVIPWFRCMRGFKSVVDFWDSTISADHLEQDRECGSRSGQWQEQVFGKPYEPNAVIKNDIEFILMERKPGGYRSPSDAARC